MNTYVCHPIIISTAGKSSEVAFNLKDFNTMVHLCESLEKMIVIMFNYPGQPLIASTQSSGNDSMYVELIITTLPEDQQQQREAFDIAGVDSGGWDGYTNKNDKDPFMGYPSQQDSEAGDIVASTPLHFPSSPQSTGPDGPYLPGFIAP